MQEIKILGVDPSLRNWGLSLSTFNLKTHNLKVEEFHIIETRKEGGRVSFDDLRRARLLSRGFLQYWSRADIVCSEIPVGSQSAASSKALSIALGALSSCQKPLIPLLPREVKSATQNPGADKKEMIEWARSKHPEAPWLTRNFKGEKVLLNKNEHLADSIAAIYAGLCNEEFLDFYPEFDQQKFFDTMKPSRAPVFDGRAFA